MHVPSDLVFTILSWAADSTLNKLDPHDLDNQLVWRDRWCNSSFMPHVKYIKKFQLRPMERPIVFPPTITHLDCTTTATQSKHVEHLTNLVMLCARTTFISDHAVIKMTNLVHLECCFTTFITDAAISQLQNLKKLTCYGCPNITSNGLVHLDLTHLDCGYCDQITDDGLRHMINLLELNCVRCIDVTDASISQMKKLTYLICHECPGITRACLRKLTNLVHLNADDNLLIA